MSHCLLPESTLCMSRVPPLSRGQCHMHHRSVLQTRFLILLEVPSIATVSGFLFFFKCSVLLRCVSQMLKSSFQAQSFCRLHFSTGKMNISGTKHRKERLFDKTSEGPGARPVFPFCSFPITGFLAWLLKRHGIKCKLRRRSLSSYISGALVEMLLCLGFHNF